jgi:hypothetical protein
MVDEKSAEAPHRWTTSGNSTIWRWQRNETPLSRFLGGTPIDVALRLFFLSLVVGALLMWLDIRPADVITEVVHFVQRLWAMGFASIRELGNYLLAGAVIVLPVWLILRLLNFRAPR